MMSQLILRSDDVFLASLPARLFYYTQLSESDLFSFSTAFLGLLQSLKLNQSFFPINTLPLCGPK